MKFQRNILLNHRYLYYCLVDMFFALGLCIIYFAIFVDQPFFQITIEKVATLLCALWLGFPVSFFTYEGQIKKYKK